MITFRLEGDLKERLKQVLHNEPLAVKRAVRKSILLLWRRSHDKTPAWRGDLRKATSWRVHGYRGVVYNNLNYAVAVHEGTAPHAVPARIWKDESSDFARWAREHGMTPFVLARHIKRKGTRAQPWMRKAFEHHRRDVVRIFEKHIDDALS